MISPKQTHSQCLQIDSVQATATGGEIGLIAYPGRVPVQHPCGFADHRLEVDLRAIVNWGAKALVSLLEVYEFELLQIKTLPDKAQALGLEWHHLPIRDMEIPEAAFEAAWLETGDRLRTLLRAGERVVLHCYAGLGRTGMIAARLLVEFGLKPDEAIRRVRAARVGAIQTKEQEEYVRYCKPVRRR